MHNGWALCTLHRVAGCSRLGVEGRRLHYRSAGLEWAI